MAVVVEEICPRCECCVKKRGQVAFERQDRKALRIMWKLLGALARSVLGGEVVFLAGPVYR